MLSGVYILVLILSYVGADCGCLRCSKHLQGIDIRGPQGRPIKVIFKRPPPKTDILSQDLPDSGYSAAVQLPYPAEHQTTLPKFYNYKIDREINGVQKGATETKCQCEAEGQSYSALVQVPVTEAPKPQRSLCNLQYHTDSVLVPPPKCYDTGEELVNNPFPIQPLTKPLRNNQNQPTCPCCCRCVHKTEIDINNKCVRCKRSILETRQYADDGSGHCEDKYCPRIKRSIAQHGYNFFMNMLPQFVRDPLRHSIRGSSMMRQSKPDTRLKLEELKLRKALEHRNMYNQRESQSYNTRNVLNNYKVPSLKYRSPYNVPRFLESHPRPLALTDKSTLPYQKSFRQSKRYQDDNSMENEQEINRLELIKKSRNYISPKKLSSRLNDDGSGDETTLLRKLKRLNNNHFTSNLEDQATAFMDQLVSPEKNPKRIKRHSDDTDSEELEIGELDGQKFNSDESASKEHHENHKRNKRTIILSSDEVDLPPQYEIEEISVEDDDYPDEMVASFEDSGDEEGDEIVAYSPFARKSSGRKMSRLFEPKPDLFLGKNVIQKAVRDELNTYHRKMEMDQRIKELKQNIEKKKNDPYGMGDTIPSNPIFMFLTAPMRFLRHFHDINKGISPVMTSLPKLVHTTKSYFRNFGKNFHKNCLNLASDIIGDFDNIQPKSVIQKIDEPHYARYRRSTDDDDDPCTIDSSGKPTKIDINTIIKECVSKSIKGDISCSTPVEEDLSQLQKELNSTSFGYLTNFIDKIQGIIDYFSTTESKEDTKPTRITPEYSAVFSSSQENKNFRTLASEHVRKKRYVVKIVNDDEEIKEQVQNYLAQQLEDDNEYLKPVKDYYKKLENIWSRSRSNSEKTLDSIIPNSSEDSYEERPKKKKIIVRKIKPRIIIDNKGLPFMEYKGYKRPLFLRKRKSDVVKSPDPPEPRSTEETGKRIDMLISRAKETSEIVGSVQTNIVPRQIVRERISSLLEEIDQLERLNAEDYDEIFENLIKIQYIKYSVEQDWKRTLIENRADDLHAQIGLLSKFKDLQHLKDITVQIIAEALKKCDNEFARRNLVHTLIRLEKLQVLITSVIDDFDQNFKMKTKLNTKKEIKYVDYLSDLNFVNAKTRNDLVKNLGKDRDREGQQNIDVLNKLKKMLVSDNEEEMEKIAKTIWEMNNLKKLQTDTIKDINKKIKKYYKIKKELKILFDLQKRFEECGYELSELLGNVSAPIKNSNARKPLKKDIKEIIAEIKRKREETLQKALERRNNLLKKKG